MNLDPSQQQLLVNLMLAACVLGAALGFLITGLVNTLLDVLMRLDDRRERINTVKHRDHSAVPRWPEVPGASQ